MMSLFDDEQIMRTYAKDFARETLIEKATLMLKKGDGTNLGDAADKSCISWPIVLQIRKETTTKTPNKKG